MTQDYLSTGTLLVQRYRLKEVVGVGGMGTVYRAEDIASQKRNVAIKILSRALDDMKMIEQFQREATISALLSERSPNIVKVTDYGVNENQIPFYVMEFLDGEDLGDFIEIHDLSLDQFFDFTLQICQAMQIAHNGIFSSGEICPVVHRDLKPSNIFIIENETGKQVIKILDFGIAQLIKDDQGQTENFTGTPKYCSPEQIQGEKIDNRSDIYSLGMVMYYMLAKKYPWDLEIDSVGMWYKAHTELSPNSFAPELQIPPELEVLILNCLAKSVKDRPQSIGEVIQKLENISRSLKINNKVAVNNFNNFQSEQNSSETTSLEKYLSSSIWPHNKPRQKIVFPRIMVFQQKIIPTVWTMLEEKDIHKRTNNIRYNQFIFQSFPHPMILWLTVLYSAEDGPRWLPCYLDLKTKIGTQLVNQLSESKEYFLLFFSLENPRQCHSLLSFKVGLKQRTNLKQWASVSSMLTINHNDEATLSRRKLKENLEELKPKILLELAKENTEEIHG
jgi:serine/threonine-protein kinase